MKFSPHNIYHIYNQGNNKQNIFLTREDYLTFLSMYKKLLAPQCETISWCLMPNHFHFMIYADEKCSAIIKQGGILVDPVTNGIRKLLSGYARIFNSRYGKSGSLFRQKTKAKCLSAIAIKENSRYNIQDYYLNCFHYIHQNPLRANLVGTLEEWEFSSYIDYAGIRNGNLCNKELAERHCNYSPVLFQGVSYNKIEESLIERFK